MTTTQPSTGMTLENQKTIFEGYLTAILVRCEEKENAKTEEVAVMKAEDLKNRQETLWKFVTNTMNPEAKREVLQEMLNSLDEAWVIGDTKSVIRSMLEQKLHELTLS